jgi:NADPH:quinone reductase
MKAVQCVEWGEPEKLVVSELPLPEPKSGEVRIKVAAAGVNFPDALIVQRKYQLKPPLPFTPGTEVAGTIDALGDGVTNLTPSAARHCLRRPRRICRICMRARNAGRADS